MAFAEFVFHLRKMNIWSSKWNLSHPLPPIATKQATRNIHTIVGPQFNSRATSSIGRFSSEVLTFQANIKDVNRIFPHAWRWYSEKGVEKLSEKRYDKDDDDGATNNSEKEPKQPAPNLGRNLIVWPNFFRTLKNTWKYSYIREHLDTEFLILDFVVGANKALHVISHKLAAADFENMKEFVESEELKRVQAIVKEMTAAQRRELAIDKGDIRLSFPAEVAIIKTEYEGDIKRIFVEIMMVYHVREGDDDMHDNENGTHIRLKFKIENSDSTTTMELSNSTIDCVANYRFRKEFTEGVEDDWTVIQIQQENRMDDDDE